MEKITTHRTSLHTAEVIEPIVIEEKNNTRRVFLANLNDTKRQSGETVSGTIVHQRKKNNDEWEDIESINLATLKGGEGVKIRFKSTPLRQFFLGLEKLYNLSKSGLSPGDTEYGFGKIHEIIKVPRNRKKFISQLLEKKFGEEIWKELIESDPDLATRLSLARVQTERQNVLKKFAFNLTQDKAEDFWQDFFDKNQWIFGYGLKYHFLTQLENQPSYGGTNFSGLGNQKGDFLLNTEADIKFTVLVEIKKPTSCLLATTKTGAPKRYRNGAWLLSSDLLGGVSQLQINCKTWQASSHSVQNTDILNSENIHTVSPKGILVIGKISELKNNREQIESFESFRRSISNPEILTFDELYERARFIAEHKQQKVEDHRSDLEPDDVPF